MNSMQASCHALLNTGVFIRAFECRAFSPKYPANPNYEVERVMQNWNQGGLERCVHKQTNPPVPLPTSFWRHDLPIKSYGNHFGLLINATTAAASCAYPMDG